MGDSHAIGNFPYKWPYAMNYMRSSPKPSLGLWQLTTASSVYLVFSELRPSSARA
jgi:hypothetical protein